MLATDPKFQQFGQLLLEADRRRQADPAQKDQSLARFGRFIKVTRKGQNLSSQELADLMGLPHVTIIGLENGLIARENLPENCLETLSDILKLPKSQLDFLLAQTAGLSNATQRDSSFVISALQSKMKMFGRWVDVLGEEIYETFFTPDYLTFIKGFQSKDNPIAGRAIC